MRVNNYDLLLIEWATRQIGKRYEWGKTDCGTLTREGLTLILGREPFPGLPAWDSEAEMRKIWGALGGADAGFLHFGAKLIAPNYAQTGDVILMTIRDINTATILIDGSKMLFSFSDKGIAYRNIMNIRNQHYRIYRFD